MNLGARGNPNLLSAVVQRSWGVQRAGDLGTKSTPCIAEEPPVEEADGEEEEGEEQAEPFSEHCRLHLGWRCSYRNTAPEKVTASSLSARLVRKRELMRRQADALAEGRRVPPRPAVQSREPAPQHV